MPSTLSSQPNSQSGFTLIEVLVAALMVALLAAGAATAFSASLDSSGGLRSHAQAQTLAEQSQSHLEGLNLDELSNLDQTNTVPVNTPGGGSAVYYVHQTASYITDATGQASCTNPAADYLKVTSTVTWPDMHGENPVSLSQVLTPTIGSIAADRGTLAISVIDQSLAGVPGATVTATGPENLSAVSTAGGCVLFGDIPTGTYTVQVTPPSGTWVDAKTGATVSATSPDTASVDVSSGATPASQQFQIGPGSTASFTFTTAFPAGVAQAAQAAAPPAVVLVDTNMNTPQYRLCAAGDSACPAVGAPDASFPANTNAGGVIQAQPLFPYTYATYAGVCSSDEPKLYGAADGSVVVAAGATTTARALKLPALVVRVVNGAVEIPVTAPARLVITDTGCGLRYIGYTGATAPTLAAGQAALPLNTSYSPVVGDTGLLASPGMPYGNYTVCYQSGTRATSATVVNKGNGEVVTLNTATMASGSC
jgi:prepilin-type N-terminal cleavage/methylation domain-containing protein